MKYQSYLSYRCTSFGDIFVSYSAVLLTGIQSKLYLPDIIILDFYMIRVHSSEQNMASPTTNSINNTPKNKVPGSIHQSDRCLEYIKYLIIFSFTLFLYCRYDSKTTNLIDGTIAINTSHDIVHSQQLIARMNKLRKAEHLCDVTLKVEQSLFPAHRLVLAAVSDYFAAMFTGEVNLFYFNLI